MGRIHPISITLGLFLILAAGGTASLPMLHADAAKPSGGPPPGYTLSWSEEFHQNLGAKPDPAVWNYDLGGGGWGNGESEVYVNDQEHAHIINDPQATDGRALQIEATTEGPGKFTSARIHTKDKLTAQYGYVEARIQLPSGKGLWPAFWMLGSDLGKAGWPGCGEVDIMENLGREPSINHGSLHGPGFSGSNSLHAAYTLPDGQQFKDAYHLFALQWSPDSITFSVDGHAYETRTPADVPVGGSWVFDHPFFFILNVAVGGGWPGSPDATTHFPQQMRVDYIRVYQPPAALPPLPDK